MTGAERQARYMARLREPQPAPARPLPMAPVPENTIRLQDLAMDPERVMRWVQQKLGNRAIRGIRAACDHILPEP